MTRQDLLPDAPDVRGGRVRTDTHFQVDFYQKHCINGLAFSSLAALAPRMLVLRISRRSLRSLLELRILLP